MKILKKFTLLVLIASFISCNSNFKESLVESSTEFSVDIIPKASVKPTFDSPLVPSNDYDFDKILKCSDYAYNGDYLVTPYNGCIYSFNGNTFGNLSIYLIPKTNFNPETNELIEKYEKDVYELDIKNLKQQFEIYIYLIPKEYLDHTPNGESLYYQKKPYMTELYTFDANQDKWTLIDNKEVTDSNDIRKKADWRESFLNKRVAELSKK